MTMKLDETLKIVDATIISYQRDPRGTDHPVVAEVIKSLKEAREIILFRWEQAREIMIQNEEGV